MDFHRIYYPVFSFLMLHLIPSTIISPIRTIFHIQPTTPQLSINESEKKRKEVFCKIASACETSLENKISLSLFQDGKCLYELFSPFNAAAAVQLFTTEPTQHITFSCGFSRFMTLVLRSLFAFALLDLIRWMPHSNSSYPSQKLNYMKVLQKCDGGEEIRCE